MFPRGECRRDLSSFIRRKFIRLRRELSMIATPDGSGCYSYRAMATDHATIHVPMRTNLPYNETLANQDSSFPANCKDA